MKTKNVALSTMLLGGLLLASAAQAGESLEDKEKWARQDHYMADHIKGANDKCGIAKGKEITNTFDKASFAKTDWSSHSPNGMCSSVWDDVASLCNGMEAAKKPVQDKIKGITCRYAGKGKFGLTLDKGMLTYNIDFEESNVDDKITAFLKKNLASGGAGGETLHSKEQWDRQDSYMADHIKSANTACGTSITLEWDKASFEKEDWTSHSPNGLCGGVFDNLRYLCANTAGAKKPVQDKIKKVSCKYAGKGKYGMSLSGGTLTYGIDWEESNVDDKMTSFLKKNL